MEAGFAKTIYPQNKIQKPKLFSLGKATSFEPIWYGIKKLPIKPNKTGVTTKKTIIKPWLVITCKYLVESPLKKKLPGIDNSILIIVAKNKPDIALKKQKYR